MVNVLDTWMLELVNLFVYHHLGSVGDHLLLSNHSASYDNFSILTREGRMLLLELKESLLTL